MPEAFIEVRPARDTRSRETAASCKQTKSQGICGLKRRCEPGRPQSGPRDKKAITNPDDKSLRPQKSPYLAIGVRQGLPTNLRAHNQLRPNCALSIRNMGLRTTPSKHNSHDAQQSTKGLLSRTNRDV